MTESYCSREMLGYLGKIDLIVFDIDGVLIDTSASFIATIITTAKYYINHILKLPVDLKDVDESVALEFKRFTGFNNDWDLTTGMVMFQLYKYKMSGRTIVLNEFLIAVDGKGGGLEGIKQVLKKESGQEIVQWIYENVDSGRIRRVFQEIYAGENYCEYFYGFTPDFFKRPGSVEDEIILLDRELLSRWKGKTGILTGRMKNETNHALQMLRMENVDRNLVEYTDYVLPDKPHPDKIERILDRSDSRFALMIGDSIDDFLIVRNYNNLKKARQLRFGLVADLPDNFPIDAREFYASTANDLLKNIPGIRKKIE